MLKININERFNYEYFNSNIITLKIKKDFRKEFEFSKGKFLGKGAFGTVK